MKNLCITFGILLAIGILPACQEDFLDEKPLKSLLVPKTTGNFQALLDDVNLMNIYPATTWVGTDDFYTTDAEWQTFLTRAERNSYTWAPDIFEGSLSSDWNQPYQQILVTNVVLEGLAELSTSDETQNKVAGQLKGAALFYRSMSFYHLLQQFAAPYSSGTLREPGIPLRLSADINVRLPRASLEQCYAQVIADLETAYALLPENTVSTTRPKKQAALALLARIYLSMGKYEQALKQADAALALNSTLLNFNLRSPNLDATGNAEVIFNCANAVYSFAFSQLSGAPLELFAQYALDDLRRQYYFVVRANGTFGYRTMVSQNIGRYSGLSIDELYLIKSECEARLQVPGNGLSTINALLVTRYKSGTFVPLQAANSLDALRVILSERRKTLAYRGTRWTDLRRLNQEPEFAVPLSRSLKNQTYTLEPKDKRYVYPIPDNEISASGLEQNIR